MQSLVKNYSTNNDNHVNIQRFEMFRKIHYSLTKNGFTELVFALQALKARIRVVLTGYTVTMITDYVKKMTATCSPMIGHWYDIILVASSYKQWLY